MFKAVQKKEYTCLFSSQLWFYIFDLSLFIIFFVFSIKLELININNNHINFWLRPENNTMLSRFFSQSVKTFSSTLRLQQNRIILNTPTRFYFTSSSNSSQVALLEEVEAKIFQVLKTAAKCNTAKLNKNATFEELGFDSLDTV